MTESSIAAARAALKTKEEALAGIVTVWKSWQATIAPDQLPAIAHAIPPDRITWASEVISGGIVAEVFTIPTRILLPFPRAVNGDLDEELEGYRRAYCDMILDNDTIAGTCVDAKAVSGEIALIRIGGVECNSALINVHILMHRGRS